MDGFWALCGTIAVIGTIIGAIAGGIYGAILGFNSMQKR